MSKEQKPENKVDELTRRAEVLEDLLIAQENLTLDMLKQLEAKTNRIESLREQLEQSVVLIADMLTTDLKVAKQLNSKDARINLLEKFVVENSFDYSDGLLPCCNGCGREPDRYGQPIEHLAGCIVAECLGE